MEFRNHLNKRGVIRKAIRVGKFNILYMKKIILSFGIMFFVLVSLASCGNKKDKNNEVNNSSNVDGSNGTEDGQENEDAFKKQDYLYGFWEYKGNGIDANYIINEANEYTFYSSVAGSEQGSWSGGPDGINFQTEGGIQTGNGYINKEGELVVANMVFTKN